jgi:hypothetical protein
VVPELRTIKNQDGKPVSRTKPAIPVFLYDYFFFLPAGFAAFFFAAMFITSDRFMEFHSAIFADGVIYLTASLYEEMTGAGNDYFIATFLARWNCNHRPTAKGSARDKSRLDLRGWFPESFCQAVSVNLFARPTRTHEIDSGKIVRDRSRNRYPARHACSLSTIQQ